MSIPIAFLTTIIPSLKRLYSHWYCSSAARTQRSAARFTAGRDSVDLLHKLLDQFGGHLNLVLVLNEIRSDNSIFWKPLGERALASACWSASAQSVAASRL